MSDYIEKLAAKIEGRERSRGIDASMAYVINALRMQGELIVQKKHYNAVAQKCDKLGFKAIADAVDITIRHFQKESRSRKIEKNEEIMKYFFGVCNKKIEGLGGEICF